MVPTIVPGDVDYMAIAKEEKARIQDNMPSTILNNIASGTQHDSTADNDGSSSSGDTQDRAILIIERIRAMIESGQASATDRNDDGITPLHLAAVTGRVPVCEYLIEKGAEVNALGGSLPATPLQWAARKGRVEIIDLLIQHGANPHLVDSQDFSCLHSVTHSSDYLALLYILCQPDIEVDKRDNMGLTPLHWAALQRDEVSVQVLLKFGANPNVVDRNGLTALHWAASGGNRSCVSRLLEAGADVRAMNRDNWSAQEMADMYYHRWMWKWAVEKVGFTADGTRVRRPLSEPGVNIIIFLFPTVELCICFTIASIFPWYMSIALSPLALIVMTEVVRRELLQRNTLKEHIEHSPIHFGSLVGYALWMAYAWITRLQYDVPDNPAIYAILLLLFVVSMLTLFLTSFCDPGICATGTKDDLKPIIRDLVRGKRLETFCIKCRVVKPQHTRHCPYCNKCVTGRGIMPSHHSRMLNCIGTKNHTYSVIFLFSHFVAILIFDYLAWKHLLALPLKDTPLPSRTCVFSDTVCKRISTDMFLVSITVWSLVEMWYGWLVLKSTTLVYVLPTFSPTVT